MADYLRMLEQENVALSLENLMTFPRLRTKVERGDLTLHGAYFGVATGQLSVRNRVTGKFDQVAGDDYARLFAKPHF
jgi:carbonic anhydrase